jgi:hypothetical protein
MIYTMGNNNTHGDTPTATHQYTSISIHDTSLSSSSSSSSSSSYLPPTINITEHQSRLLVLQLHIINVNHTDDPLFHRTVSQTTGRNIVINKQYSLGTPVFTSQEDVFLTCSVDVLSSHSNSDSNCNSSRSSTLNHYDNDNIIRDNNDHTCGICMNQMHTHDEDHLYHCGSAMNSYMNIIGGTLHVGASWFMNGRLRVERNSIIELDGGDTAIYILESINENYEIQPIVLHGRIIVLSGTLLLKSPIIGSGQLRVSEGAYMELSSNINTLISFNSTDIPPLATLPVDDNKNTDDDLSVNDNVNDIQHISSTSTSTSVAAQSDLSLLPVTMYSMIHNEGSMLFSRGIFSFASPLVSTGIGSV